MPPSPVSFVDPSWSVKSLRGQLPTIMAFWGSVVSGLVLCATHHPRRGRVLERQMGSLNGPVGWVWWVLHLTLKVWVQTLSKDAPCPQGAKGALGSPVSPLLPSGTWIAWHLLATLPSGSALCPIVWHPAPWECLRWSCQSPNLLC